MPINGEIIERSINDLQKVQKRMLLAKKENAVETLTGCPAYNTP